MARRDETDPRRPWRCPTTSRRAAFFTRSLMRGSWLTWTRSRRSRTPSNRRLLPTRSTRQLWQFGAVPWRSIPPWYRRISSFLAGSARECLAEPVPIRIRWLPPEAGPPSSPGSVTIAWTNVLRPSFSDRMSRIRMACCCTWFTGFLSGFQPMPLISRPSNLTTGSPSMGTLHVLVSITNTPCGPTTM
jgi:hypothetical protein